MDLRKLLELLRVRSSNLFICTPSLNTVPGTQCVYCEVLACSPFHCLKFRELEVRKKTTCYSELGLNLKTVFLAQCKSAASHTDKRKKISRRWFALRVFLAGLFLQRYMSSKEEEDAGDPASSFYSWVTPTSWAMQG